MRSLSLHKWRNISCTAHLYWILFCLSQLAKAAGDIWPLERPEGMPSIQSLEVMCGKDHMDVHLSFSHPFEGIVSSKGQHGDPRCIYVPPSTGQTFFSFRIAYAKCGTKPDLHGQFYENTVVVQYDKDLLEVWDEAKRLRCEWFNDYEKTASKPPMVIADLDVIQLDFRGDNVDCWMEIQHGKGPWAPPVSGIVPLGSTLTLVVAINDHRGEFDMRVKSCIASDGSGHVIQLSDEFGCVLRPKMISRFLKARGADDKASVITYAFFHAFKFPDALSVHIKCKVEICRYGCLDHCQIQSEKGDVNPDLAHYIGNPLERKDTNGKPSDHRDNLEPNTESEDGVLYDDIIQEGEGGASIHTNFPGAKNPHNSPLSQSSDNDDLKSAETHFESMLANKGPVTFAQDKFPHGPRTFEETPVAAPRSLSQDASVHDEQSSAFKDPSVSSSKDESPPNKTRRRRSVVVSDRKVRSADVGVSSLYEVISEADLAFSPDSKAEAVTVFQGKIREEVVYGICMPVPGFSILFVMVAVSAVVSALVAGSLLYRYQLQREQIAEQAQRGSLAMSSFVNWMSLRLLRTKQNQPTPDSNGTICNPVNGKTEQVHD